MVELNLTDNFTRLGTPFADGPAVGSDPRQDVTPGSLYFRLRDARSDARADERLADNDPAAGEMGSRQWKTVRDLALLALAERGKDIEIAAWLTESLVRSDGLDGLVAGAGLMRLLIERFWSDGLFPVLDEDGPEARLAAIGGLSGSGSDGTLLQPLRKIVLFERADGTPVTFWQFEQAREVSTLGDAARKAQRLAAGVPPLAELDGLARGTGRASMQILALQTVQALAAWTGLEKVLGEVVPADMVPSMRRVHDLLNDLRRILDSYVPAAAEHEASGPDAPGNATETTDSARSTDSNSDADLSARASDRNGMLDEVMRIAAVFRRTEPNSPFSYTLEDAVRRARLPWPELLEEMLPEAGARSSVLSGLGIRVGS
jgi:type VI secretion system protein ImpA